MMQRSKIIAICFIVIFYLAAFLSFVMGEIKEQADDEKLRNMGIHISFYMRSTYWDIIGIGFLIVATTTAIGTYRHFRYKTPENLNSLSLRN